MYKGRVTGHKITVMHILNLPNSVMLLAKSEQANVNIVQYYSSGKSTAVWL